MHKKIMSLFVHTQIQ